MMVPRLGAQPRDLSGFCQLLSRKMSSKVWSKSRKKIGRLTTVSRSTANRARGLEHGACRDTVFVTLQEPDLEGELRRKINANMEARKVSTLRFLDR